MDQVKIIQVDICNIFKRVSKKERFSLLQVSKY